MSQAMPRRKDEDGPEQYFELVTDQLGTLVLDRQAGVLVRNRVFDAYRIALTAEGARMSLFADRCVELGKNIGQVARDRGETGQISLNVVEQVFAAFCPGWWPFC